MTPRAPFKFLDAYTKEDAEIFFGRETEIEELYNRVFSTNHLLVYGQSGTGKTSLIQCGLANRFEESDWLPIFIRYGENIFVSLEREIARLAVTPIPQGHPLDKTLHSLYLDYFKPIYLIFDQFEELFIFGSADERQRLSQTLASLENAPVELKILFVIREEYLAELTALERYLPDLFRNRLRVERLGHAELLRAGPVRSVGSVLMKDWRNRHALEHGRRKYTDHRSRACGQCHKRGVQSGWSAADYGQCGCHGQTLAGGRRPGTPDLRRACGACAERGV
jgi:hypothetical protein